MHGTAVSTTVLKPLATTSMPIGHQMVYDHDWHHDHDGPR
jgi:hypothetical protein